MPSQPGPQHWFAWLVAHLLQSSTVRSFAMVAAILLLTAALEIAGRKGWRVRYGSRGFRVDVIYYVFYYSGLYHFLVLAWLYKAIAHTVSQYAPWAQVHLLKGVPDIVQFLALYVVVDFIHYWNHRWRHANRFLWAFHSIHHSQTAMTAMTNYRFHIVDETLVRICMFLPFQLILGTAVSTWLWLDFIITWVLLLEHSELDWSYGWLGRIFISPAFHRTHHSTEEHAQNCNFGGTFSFWDDLFGTSERKLAPPLVCGLKNNSVPETLSGQFVYPFASIMRQWILPARTASANAQGPLPDDAVAGANTEASR